LFSLGLEDWRISFSMDEETKSGSVKKGFSTFVKSPHNKTKVRWEAWSGGEGQRLRIAGSMGLINLILSRRGYTTNIEIWDEPSNYLSDPGIRNLLETLAMRAQTLDKQIWVVDHRTFEYGGFEKVIKIVKDKKGSHILEEHNYD
jgi:energy-coupling factor transporter ATP-binding protein EcfA2